MTSQSQPSGRVVVALPTMSSESYIARSLDRLVPELRELATGRDVTLALCVNGPDPDGRHAAAARSALVRVNDELPHVDTHLIIREPAGKNAALEELIRYARSIDATYFLVTDDDVVFSPGTLARNIEALAASPAERLTLVGARILTPPRPLRSFLPGLPLRRALTAWWWQSVFRLPYEPQSEFFLFSPGPCSAMRVADYPELPADDSGITDDAYINYWIVANGGVIHQPPGSTVFFHVSSEYPEWIRQQTRILAGIESTLALFKEQSDEIRRVFAWAYSHNREARVPARCYTPRRLLLLIFYRRAQADLLRQYAQLSGTPDWGRAETTKHVA